MQNSKPKTIRGYQLGQRIGKGAYAQVYKCSKKQTGETFAMKIFKQVPQNQPEKIKKQVDIVQKLIHPNIIQCYEYFEEVSEDSTKLYAVFEYCGKGNLSEYMDIQKERRTKIPQKYAKSYIWKILDALIYLHKNKIAHRDLKLANILINDNYEIKLADFGLSKMFGQEDQMLKTMCGTPLTMAPEIMGKQRYTEKCDTWSFGVISYYMIFSEYPFNGGCLDELKKNILTQRVPYFPDRVKISDECKNFLSQCLTVDVNKRPKIQDLEQHKWFIETAQSVIRAKFMKNSMGQNLELMRKVNSCLQYTIDNYILNLIKSSRLTDKNIKPILKGFEDLYPDKKWQCFLFILYVGQKIKMIENSFVELKISSRTERIDNKDLKKLIKHNKYTLEMLKGKAKALKQQMKELDKQKCQNTYQQLLKFVVIEALKQIEDSKVRNIKIITFLKQLTNFLNSVIQTSNVTITNKFQNPEPHPQSSIQVDELQIYIEDMLDKKKILTIVNSEDDGVDRTSPLLNQIKKQWEITYQNKLMQVNDAQTYKMTGQIIQRALTVKELVEKSNVDAKSQ